MKWSRKWTKWTWIALALSVASIVAGLQVINQSKQSKAQIRALRVAGAGGEFRKRGDIESALEKYKEAVNIQPRSAYTRALLGRAYHELDKDDEAMEQYKSALELSPRHFWVHYLIGQLYRDQGRYHDAIRKFNELVAMKDNWYSSNKILGNTEYQKVAYGELGYCYAEVGDRQRAVESYEKYLTLNPSAQDRAAVKEYIKQLKGE